MKLTLRMVAVLAAITLASGALLSSLNQWAEPRVKKHARERIDRAINSLFPGQPEYKEIAEYEKNLPLYVCYDKTGDTLGYAFKARGTGYQGVIELIAAAAKDLSHLQGIKILKQVETPGLGARITEYDASLPPRDKADSTDLNKFKFRNWFEQVKVGFAGETPPLDYVKNKIPEKENHVQAITGATISSRAVVTIVNKALKKVKKTLARTGRIQQNKGENRQQND